MSPTEYNTLIQSLQAKTSASDAARTFTEPTRTAFLAGEDLEEHLGRTYDALIKLAAETKHESQDVLVEIVRAIQQDDITKENDGKMCVIWDEELKIWEDMPLFGASMREAWNRGSS